MVAARSASFHMLFVPDSKRQADAAPVVALDDVEFGWSPRAPAILRIASFRLAPGERLFLRGPSGSGKSTLLALVAGVAAPRAGRVAVLGEPLHALAPAQRDRFRADHLGLVFQLFNLVPYLSVVENVTLPCLFSARRRSRAQAAAGSPGAEARRLLGRLGMGDEALLARPVTTLSVGQQQRVAVARALIGSPGLVIADEATSALDADARDAFLDLLLRECEGSGAAVVFASHDASLAGAFHRSVSMADLSHG